MGTRRESGDHRWRRTYWRPRGGYVGCVAGSSGCGAALSPGASWTSARCLPASRDCIRLDRAGRWSVGVDPRTRSRDSRHLNSPVPAACARPSPSAATRVNNRSRCRIVGPARFCAGGRTLRPRTGTGSHGSSRSLDAHGHGSCRHSAGVHTHIFEWSQHPRFPSVAVRLELELHAATEQRRPTTRIEFAESRLRRRRLERLLGLRQRAD